MPSDPILALDTSSPVVSVALSSGGTVAYRSTSQRRSSALLLGMIGELLDELDLTLRHLRGVVALQGPGSFTGLRVGLATAWGFHQALGLAATALPTLTVLAAASPRRAGPIAALVDALRGEWFVQIFTPESPPQPLSPPLRLAAADLRTLPATTWVGFGLDRLRTHLGSSSTARLMVPDALAAVASRLVRDHPVVWNSQRLLAPLYLRGPAVTPQGRRRGAGR